MSTKDCTLQIRVSPAVREALEEVSLQKGEVISVVVREAIRQYLASNNISIRTENRVKSVTPAEGDKPEKVLIQQTEIAERSREST